MINTNASELKEATQTGNEFKKLVNDRYRLLEIDIDAIFQRMLLLQKKKYAAIKVEDGGESTMEIKGLDMKRREFCPLSKTVSGYVLKQILSGEATEHVVEHVHDYLESIGKRVRAGEVDLDEFIILKRLGKNPQDYPDAKSQPHVQVALRMQAKGQTIKAGDVIPYVFCLAEDGITAKSAKADRAFHPDDLRKKDTTLKIGALKELVQTLHDYLLKLVSLHGLQITTFTSLCKSCRLPSVFAIPSKAPSALVWRNALVSTRTVSARSRHRSRASASSTALSRRSRMPNALPCASRLPCGAGHASMSRPSAAYSRTRCVYAIRVCSCVKSSLTIYPSRPSQNGMLNGSGLHCTKIDCAAWLSPASVQIQVENQVRAAISKFYESWLVCDDQSCGNRTRMLGMVGRRCLKLECRGKMHNEVCLVPIPVLAAPSPC